MAKKTEGEPVVAPQATVEELQRQLSAMQAELERSKKGNEVKEGLVVHDSSVPANVKRPAFGRQAITFEDISNFNWRVMNTRKREKKRVYVAEENSIVDLTKERTPATMFTITLRRMERDSNGNIAQREHSETVNFPYYTFDNKFTRMGISPRDVALAIWSMRDAWGRNFEVYQMSEDEVSTYYTDSMSEEQITMREAMADPSRIAVLQMRNAELLAQPVA